MKKLHSQVIVKDLTGKVIEKLDIQQSNIKFNDMYTIRDNRISTFMHRYTRRYNLS